MSLGTELSRDLGDIAIRTLHTPGHTDGTTTFFFDDVDDYGNKLCVGILGGLGLNTLIPDDPKQNTESFVFRRKAYRKSMEMLKEQHVDITASIHPAAISLIPQTGKSINGQSLYHNSEIWGNTIDKYLRRLDEVEAESF